MLTFYDNIIVCQFFAVKVGDGTRNYSSLYERQSDWDESEQSDGDESEQSDESGLKQIGGDSSERGLEACKPHIYALKSVAPLTALLFFPSMRRNNY